MVSYSPDHYYRVLDDLINCQNITSDTFKFFNTLLNEAVEQNRFGSPMLTIGIYIATASLICILLLVADVSLVNTRTFWFPCKYFTLNAATLTLIAVAVKLPMDLNNPMVGDVDQAAKCVSMGFMITMMANLLPSLGSMDGKQLLTNIIALGILVITLVVNVCIQLQTGVINSHSFVIATIHVIMLFLMLMIYVSSALTILKSKQILESKYQACHNKALNELRLQQPRLLMTEKLTEYVNKHWIMAVSGSPQFMVARSATSFVAAVICYITVFLNLIFVLKNIMIMSVSGCKSDYKWSTLVIYIIQYIGLLIGIIAPLWRCYASLSLKLSRKWICSHINVFKVESYCTQKLYEWKRSNIPLSIKSRRCKFVIHTLKVITLDFCIGIQIVFVVACKMTSLIPILIVICVMYCWSFISTLGFVSERETLQLPPNEDPRQYVLQLQDEELADRSLKAILRSANHSIQKAVKQNPTNLMKVLVGFRSFEGVSMYDMHQVPPSLVDEFSDCWSLTLVTLAAIAISLPNVRKDMVETLLSGVSEGLTYVKLVEENLNSTQDYVNIQKVSKMLWLEVEVHYTWLGNKLQNTNTQVNSAEQILQWFMDTAKNLITEMENTDIPSENSIYRSVSANSMYRITQETLDSYYGYIDVVTHVELFTRLSSMISKILAACLTNLPKVIELKCHTNAIEKREASVHATAQILGQTMEIIRILRDDKLPDLNQA